MPVTTQHATLSSLPDATAISTTRADGGLEQVVQLSTAEYNALLLLATAAKQDTSNATLGSILTELLLKARLADTQPVNTGLAQPLTDTQLRASAVAVTVAALALLQGVSGAGVAGPLVQGLVDQSPPSYAPGNIQALSMTPDGHLRTVTKSQHDIETTPTPKWVGRQLSFF